MKTYKLTKVPPQKWLGKILIKEELESLVLSNKFMFIRMNWYLMEG